MASTQNGEDEKVSITPLLKRLWHESPSTKPTATEIAAALGLIFTNSLSEVQTGALLTCLHFTDLDRQAEILAKCSQAMREFATGIDTAGLTQVIEKRGRKEGNYHGGLVSSILFIIIPCIQFAVATFANFSSSEVVVIAAIGSTLCLYALKAPY